MDNGLMFGRVAQVTTVTESGNATTIGNAYEIQYSAEFTSGKSSAVITIKNPPKTQQAIAETAKTVSLVAGYEKYSGVIFTGTITDSESARNGTDSILTIKAKGESGDTSKKITISGAPGTTASAILATISAHTLSKVSLDSRVIDESYAAGFAFVGRAKKAIVQVATKVGAKAIVQPTGATLLVPIDDTTPPTEIIVVTAKTSAFF